MVLSDASSELVLDWRIRVFVLLPITFATALVGVLRHNVMMASMRPPRLDLFKVRDAAALCRSSALRRAAPCLHPAQFEARRLYLAAAEGPLQRVAMSSSGPLAMMMNPELLANQVTSLLASTVPSMLLGAWANYFFGGFAVCRLPFPLSQRFRGMLQSGIERVGQSLDVRYVSALSWYVINLFGNTGVTQLFLSDFAPRGGFSDPVAVSRAERLLSSFQGFNDERDAERKGLRSMKYKYLLVEMESKLLKSDPQKIADM